jgi:cysteinyl-tRNA synthetase
MSDVPEEVRALAAEREEARAAKDFARADALRDAIAELGFKVVDSPQGPAFEPVVPAEAEAPKRLRPNEIGSVLEEPTTCDASVHWVCEGWPEDIVRALAGFRAFAGDREVQYVVADVSGVDPEVFGEDVEVLSLAEGTGWAAARNAGLRRSHGRIVLAMDGSVEPTGDVLGPLQAALADRSIGVCGPFGIVTQDLQRFDESAGVGGGREVDAIEGYLMAFRREVLLDAGPFDEKFKWYRTADIEWSFRVKDTGLRAVVVEVPVAKYEHRMWFETAPAERAKWSKRNYYRFLERFRGRFDLLVSPAEEPSGPG